MSLPLTVPATTLQHFGSVHEVVPREELDEAALRILEQGLPEAQSEMLAVRQAVDDFEFEQALEHLRAVRQLLSREIAE